MAKTIERKLSEAGYKMLGEGEIENLILSILEKEDNRFLKAIPYLIYLHNPDLDRLYAKIKNKNLLGEIISITRKIFTEERIQRKLPQLDRKGKLNYTEFKEEFELQKRSSQKPTLLQDKEKIYAERNLQMWLSQLFTKKEKQTIQRIINEKPISKTDSEYYSRKTKKKLNAIINLKDLASSLLPVSPKIDQELFELKRLLEEFMGEGYVLKTFLVDGKFIIVTGTGQGCGIKLSEIKNERLRKLIDKYKAHNFEE